MVVAAVCVLFLRGGGTPPASAGAAGSASVSGISSGAAGKAAAGGDAAKGGTGASCRAPATTSATASAPALPPGPDAAPIDVRVTVLNGSGAFGQAETVLTWMQNHQGYLRTSNGGPASVQAHTSLVYAPAHADQARTLVAAMRLPASALHATGKDTGPRTPMVLTLGQDFRGVGKPLAQPAGGCPAASG
ncbi:LytR C-terminal domain-containing protein [Phaeacidiphilus oryzae]|uniref:LytR C-terminal domain-containing protein n=1 Tax=Phaeacidiphilus oryzae TaxID=348818 RepID=UPI000B147AF6|nr:LytR C-terminal domain-containing protein [Phaeacidiphilus oryzae]